MLWKIYFWAYTILTLIGLIFVYGRKSSWAFVDFLDVLSSVIIVFAVYSYVYKKEMFTQKFWDISLKLMIVSTILEILYKFTNFNLLSSLLESREVTNGQDVLIGLIISLPALYALQQLGRLTKKAK